MDFDCIETERRLAIALNDYLSLAKRKWLIESGKPLQIISKEDPKFRMYMRETRDIIHWLSRSTDNSIIWYNDDSFPHFGPLKAHLPYMLLCVGQKPQKGGKCAAIVGTRHATYAGIQEAFRFGMEATENSLSVISGFAEGIDQSGMNGAIAGGGPCIGVLACGHDVEYPGLTMGMRKRILDCGGCVLSRFAPKHMPYKSNFISRTMVIAAYSSFVIAVQAPGRSGTLSTCDFALQMGKEVYVGSQGIGDRFVQAGTCAMFRDGAKVVSSLTDGQIPGIDFRFHVLECDDRIAADEADDSYRFGDRTYVVQELIG